MFENASAELQNLAFNDLVCSGKSRSLSSAKAKTNSLAASPASVAGEENVVSKKWHIC